MTPVPPDPAAGPPVPVRAARTPGGPGLSPSPERPGGKTSRLLPVPGPPRAAAGIQSPAGGARASSQATSAPPAGSMAVMAAAMTEDRGRDSLDTHVRRLIRDLGLMAYHTRDSRRSAKGYPDWTIAGPDGVMWRELKTQRGRVTAEQQAWLDALAAAGMNAKVWRPDDLLNGTVAAELAALAGRRTAGGVA